MHLCGCLWAVCDTCADVSANQYAAAHVSTGIYIFSTGDSDRGAHACPRADADARAHCRAYVRSYGHAEAPCRLLDPEYDAGRALLGLSSANRL
jgi:hypothetical protein